MTDLTSVGLCVCSRNECECAFIMCAPEYIHGVQCNICARGLASALVCLFVELQIVRAVFFFSFYSMKCNWERRFLVDRCCMNSWWNRRYYCEMMMVYTFKYIYIYMVEKGSRTMARFDEHKCDQRVGERETILHVNSWNAFAISWLVKCVLLIFKYWFVYQFLVMC